MIIQCMRIMYKDMWRLVRIYVTVYYIAIQDTMIV